MTTTIDHENTQSTLIVREETPHVAHEDNLFVYNFGFLQEFERKVSKGLSDLDEGVEGLANEHIKMVRECIHYATITTPEATSPKVKPETRIELLNNFYRYFSEKSRRLNEHLSRLGIDSGSLYTELISNYTNQEIRAISKLIDDLDRVEKPGVLDRLFGAVKNMTDSEELPSIDEWRNELVNQRFKDIDENISLARKNVGDSMWEKTEGVQVMNSIQSALDDLENDGADILDRAREKAFKARIDEINKSVNQIAENANTPEMRAAAERIMKILTDLIAKIFEKIGFRSKNLHIGDIPEPAPQSEVDIGSNGEGFTIHDEPEGPDYPTGPRSTI